MAMNESYGVNFIPLLSATMRIADIHDSCHELGVAPSSFSENRGKNSDGLWLEIAARLLHYLYDEDMYSNEGWVTLTPFIEDTSNIFNINEIDIQYVINYLSTPTRITTCVLNDKQRRPKSTKNTALIEQPHGQSGSRARLTDIGRRTIVLSQAAQRWLYAHHDAEKILSAIEMHDFASIPQLCLSLSQSIRSFSHQIRRVMERPGIDEIINTFRSDSEQYSETIKKVYQGVVSASRRLADSEIQEAFLLWMDTNKDISIDPHFIHRSFDELMQSVEGLGRVFSKFVEAALDSDRKVIGCVRFDKAAIKLACEPPRDSLERIAFDAIGPWLNTLDFLSPDDFVGCIKRRERKEKIKRVVYDGEVQLTAPAPIYQFLEKYRDEIIKRIQDKPVSISDAINNGWAEINTDLFTGQLIGVFSSPDWLGKPDSKISLSVKKGGLHIRLPNGRLLVGDDLLISLEEK